jgi:aminodeoxychorismate synthase component I
MPKFAALNSWSHPGLIYQAENPVEVVEGGWNDWDKLAAILARYRSEQDSDHPNGAAIGYFTYEGEFSFGIFPEIRVVANDPQNDDWKRRRQEFRAETAEDSPWKGEQTQQEFEERVARAQEYIVAGDIYQVNLAQKFSRRFSGNPYALFEQLLWRGPVPGGSFLDWGDRQILSSSMELFLRIQGRQIVTRPIKGTRPRDRDPLRDEQLAHELRTDPKEIAELIMITDLERNDLGRVCEYGSVTVTDLMRLERYAHVFHLVSTVEGRLRPEVEALQAIRACFPGGSISGAPKKRACEIIAELEPSPRGLYTGAIGYLGFNGDAAFSVAIRTMILEKGNLHFHVGSGLTASSRPEHEYQETLHKAVGMRQAAEAYGHPLPVKGVTS